MSEIAIKAENLTKIYKIYERDVDRLKETFHPFHKRYSRDFYALNNVSFEIRRGENVGLVGKNGAGKSTLLKIITGVLTPSGGNLQVNGRIASLLELGAGFNPDMTGVENIYMNGLLIGHSRAVMDKKIDEIIDFADIGDFINQQVKTYSSGMFARLAFAVNAFVEPDILIVDEALSVGDAFFQSKCMDKMRSMINGGVTVIFVSHDTFAVKNLCERAFLMQNGKILMDSSAREVVETYRNMLLESRGEKTSEETMRQNNLVENLRGSGNNLIRESISAENLSRGKEIFTKNAAYQRTGDKRAVFDNVQLLNLDGELISEVIFGQEVVLRMIIRFNNDVSCLSMGYHIRNTTGIDLIYTDSRFNDTKAIFDAHKGEIYAVDWKFKVELHQGLYDIAAVISIPLDEMLTSAEICDFVPCALQFNVVSPNAYLNLTGGYVHWHNDLIIRRIID